MAAAHQSSAPDTASELLRQAHACIGQGLTMMKTPTPETLNECEPLLNRAGGHLQTLREFLGKSHLRANPELSASALRLQQEISRFNLLLDSAATFYLGWTRLMGGLDAGYTAEGVPATLDREQSLSIEA